MEKITLELTKEEAMQLIKFINVVVKQVGIEDGGEVVSNCLNMMAKINGAFQPKAESVTSEVKKEKLNGVLEH